MAYTKLFSEIIGSTIWDESPFTKVVWITMLALKDERHEVRASIPGLAHLARIPVEECQKAIDKFLSPDPYSRTKDFEGRRIEEIDGGWHILNGEKYRRRRNEDERREYMRKYMQGYRSKDVNSCKQMLTEVSNVSPTEQNRTDHKKDRSINTLPNINIKPSIRGVSREKIAFDWQKGTFLNISESDLKKWGEAYPALDIKSQLKKLETWLLANPTRAKKNYARWIVNCLASNQDRVKGSEKNGLNGSGSTNDPSEGEWSVILEHIRRKGTSQRCEGISDRARKALNDIGGMGHLGMARTDQMPFLKKDFKNAYLNVK